jgi:hypothetical protein
MKDPVQIADAILKLLSFLVVAWQLKLLRRQQVALPLAKMKKSAKRKPTKKSRRCRAELARR